MKWLIGVGMVCVTWLWTSLSHDEVKRREFDTQIEIARAMARYAKPSVQVEPQKEKL